MFIPGDVRSVDPLKSILAVSSHGLFLEFHRDDSETAAVKRPVISGIYSILPDGLDAGETDPTGLRSESNSLVAFDDVLDTSVKDEGFVDRGFRANGSSGVDRDGGHSPVVGDISGGVGAGVGGSTFMTGTKDGESKSLFPLDVYVKCVSGSRLLFALSTSSSVASVS